MPHNLYFDHNATTPIAPEVLQTMLPYLNQHFGNPSSLYSLGKQAAQAIEHARKQVASLIHADPSEILFTSCGTESDNTAILSALRTTGKRHIVTTQVEHSAIHNLVDDLEIRGYGVTQLPVHSDGTLDPQQVADAIRPDTAIVSIMWANNETGVLFPIHEIAKICQEKNVLFHTDAIQAIGKIPVHVHNTPIHFLSLSAHKIYAPKGIGALYIRRGTPFKPLLIGGAQEQGRRGGTENVASIVAFGKAAELAASRLPHCTDHLRLLRDTFETQILQAIPTARINGHPQLRLPNTTNITFPHQIPAEALLLRLSLQGVSLSAGSACTSGSVHPSHVLTAMGLTPTQAKSSLRFSFGITQTLDDIQEGARKVIDAYHHLRKTLQPVT
ncbi:MAG: IscS subfamily cysteine desulfurase [Methylacidiphilales bacterium]|nr:IscS subfamily cysteine desulfurase [Candidatus Methylacidiphilales bacterium]MDW8350151.1 IscS subfamily cysteine desulfurase [Verrucomicrobiae bacterium]